MMKKNLYRRILYLGITLLTLVCLTGCAKESEKKVVEESVQTEEEEEAPFYVIMEHDTEEERIVLYSYTTGLEYYYEYDISTQFQNKYGGYASVMDFVPGKIVSVEKGNVNGPLKKVQISDQVWEYKDVRRYSIDSEKGIFTIADTKYSILEQYFLFSNGERITAYDLSEDDILTVTGQEKKILSVIVTTGHGTLALKNTELFEGSYIQLNSDIFALITENMEMEIPEGNYTLKVANDGWGGTTEIEVVRGETTEIDLDTLKGEGKKKGLINFDLDIEDVSVYVDYELIDHELGVELTYGVHVIEIEAPGYNTWKKYLSVNSEKATIVIDLEEDEDAEVETEETETETEAEEVVENETEMA